ncbi:hypothetical protein P3G55_03765 [Leptospira sp. 96542]|nr:hypothetical protein [Leptospira sp. 96542]
MDENSIRILIDTNIFIPLEDHKEASNEFYKFYKLAIENNCKIIVHQSVFEDLENDKNQERRSIIKAKLKKYGILENPAEPNQEFYDLCNVRNSHDKIDAKLLFQVNQEYVELLITEDKGIFKNAKKLNIESKVKNIQDGLNFLLNTFRFVIPLHPILTHGSVREIISRKDEVFFDSLREGYKDFDKWLEDCAKQDRSAYYLIIEDELSALLIYKKESNKDHGIKNIDEETLKICTFKVGESTFGNKVGELFLSKMFAYCIEAKVNYLYLTVYPQHDRLIKLLELYGFEQSSTNEKGEIYMIKEMKISESIEDEKKNSTFIHPFYFDSMIFGKFIIPIEENYAETLFKDSEFREPLLFDKNTIQEIQGNTIQKAYICNSKVKLDKGDIILFYISKTIKKIFPVGIVDSYHRVSDISELMSLVAKRTVFQPEELEWQLNEKKALTVLLFRLVTYLKYPVTYRILREMKSCQNNLTTFTRLSDEDYKKIKEKGHFDERYIIN